MPAVTLSISLDADLATAVRAAAAEQRSSISAWLAQAASAQIRRRNLQIALATVIAEAGELTAEEIERRIAAAR